MAKLEPKTARQLALKVLNSFNPLKHDAAEILHKIIHKTDQRAAATDIVFGVIRNRHAADIIISKTASVPITRISKKILNILRIATYELIYTTDPAQYAIVNEAVNLAHTITGKKQAGFVNAVLRNIIRNIEQNRINLDTSDPSRTLPVSPKTGCQFRDDILPNPKTKPAAYLSDAFSLPKWLTDQWIDEFGFDVAKNICFASNRRPSIFLQPNTLKISTEALLEKLKALDDRSMELEILPEAKMIRIKTHKPISDIDGFAQGLFTVQDPTAAAAADVLSPKPGQTIIDLCAAPGGKTIRMAQLMNNKGKIIATDIDNRRLEKVNQNCRRLGISIVQTVPYNQLYKTIAEISQCDAVMLDVPCSNTAVLARRCEARLRINKNFLKSLLKTQYQLLEKTGNFLTPTGKICYSTCSILKQENSSLLKAFLSANPNFYMHSEKRVLPSIADMTSYDYDGGYVAIIVKK